MSLALYIFLIWFVGWVSISTTLYAKDPVGLNKITNPFGKYGARISKFFLYTALPVLWMIAAPFVIPAYLVYLMTKVPKYCGDNIRKVLDKREEKAEKKKKIRVAVETNADLPKVSAEEVVEELRKERFIS